MANPFYVAPPNISGGLEALMSGLKTARVNSARQEAVQAMQGGDTRGALARLMSIGDMQGAQVLGSFGNNERDFAFRQQAHADTLRNQDRSYQEGVRQFNIGVEGQKIPAGFERNPAGGLRPIPGGEKDPKYIAETRKPPQMSVGDITKLSDEGGKFSNLTGFITNFKDEYSGKIGQGLGNAITRYTPDWMTTPGDKDIANWWQSYDSYKNVVRNDLFGSALTPGEQREFLKADIHPGMPADLVKKNLARQQQIVQSGIQRKAAALVQGGHDANVISKAYGLSPEQLGVAPSAAPSQAQAQPQYREGMTATGPGGKKIKFQGGQWVPM